VHEKEGRIEVEVEVEVKETRMTKPEIRIRIISTTDEHRWKERNKPPTNAD
jgi:hypothetical protein